MAPVTAVALEGLPEIRPGDDLAALIAVAVPGGTTEPDDVLVIAHKVVSKAEGRTRALSQVIAGERAVSLAADVDKDPRRVQIVLDESREIRRAAPGVLISLTHDGDYALAQAMLISDRPDAAARA